MSAQPTAEARQDYDKLLQALMPFAEQMLKQHGEFFPFGASISTTGEPVMQAGYDGNEQPAPEDVVALLVKGMHAEATAGKIRASAICYDGRIVRDGKKIDAVIVSLEHVSGNATKTCVPYVKKLFGGYRFSDMIASIDDPKVFAKA